MLPTKFIYRHSVTFFIIFFTLSLWAFWVNYYGRITEEMPFHTHFHGVVMTLWCMLLISQGLLIRLKKHTWHKASGKLSYILVPLIIISGFHISYITIGNMQPGTNVYYFWVALMFNAIIAFSVLYALAMWYRKKPAVHARYMVSTVFPLVTPVTDRIIHIYIPSLRDLVPTINGMPMVQIHGFLLANLVLLIMVLWDWRVNNRPGPFLTALIIVLIYHISVLTFHRFSFWHSISHLIMG